MSKANTTQWLRIKTRDSGTTWVLSQEEEGFFPMYPMEQPYVLPRLLSDTLAHVDNFRHKKTLQKSQLLTINLPEIDLFPILSQFYFSSAPLVTCLAATSLRNLSSIILTRSKNCTLCQQPWRLEYQPMLLLQLRNQEHCWEVMAILCTAISCRCITELICWRQEREITICFCSNHQTFSWGPFPNKRKHIFWTSLSHGNNSPH